MTREEIIAQAKLYGVEITDADIDDDELVDPPETYSPAAQINGKKNIPMQDVDETDFTLYNSPVNSNNKAVLETAGVTASSILANNPESVNAADERDVVMDEKNLITTKEAAELLNVSTSTLRQWRERKLFGCEFFAADKQKNGAWFYERERVEQLKAVYQKGILQNMYKLARHFDEVCLFDICVTSGKPKKIFLEGMEVADILGVTEMTLTKWRKERKNLLPDFVGHEGTYFYEVNRVLNYMSNKNGKAESPAESDYVPQSSAEYEEITASTDNGTKAIIQQLENLPDEVKNDNCDVLRPSISDADIAAIKSMSASEQNALKLKINRFDLRAILPADKRGDGFICPICGNGSGRTGDGIKPQSVLDNNGNPIWLYHCFANDDFKGDLIKVIASLNNLDTKSDFHKILAIGKRIIENPSAASYTPPSNTTDTNTEYTPEQLAKVKADIETYAQNIEQLPVEDRRGLSLDTYKHFNCGFTNKFYHPTTNNFGGRRIIIPTGEYSYNAIMPLSDRNDVNKKWKSINAGHKNIFNAADIVPNKAVIVVEGEIDAASIWQVSGVNVIAIGGAASHKKFLEHVEEKIPADTRENYQFIILFDNDDTGIGQAKKLTDALIKIGCPAISDFLSTDAVKVDANDILTSQGGDALKSRVNEIISAAQINLAELRKNISDRQINKNQSEGLTTEQHIELFSGSFDDFDNARRIAYLFKNELRYVRDSDIWATYDGAKWILSGDSKSSAIEPFISKLAIKLKAAAKTEKENKLAKIFRQAKKTNPAISKLKGVEEIFITQKDLNTHKNLLNCKNGVVDLESRKVYPHESSLLLTQQVNAVYIPDFHCDVVDNFLESIMPDDETRAALIRFLGYSLTGETNEEKALFFHGEGGNGKGSLTSTVLKLFGNYGAAFPIKAILSSSQPKDSDAPTPSRAKLLHTRLAIAEEIPMNKMLDAAEFKLLTGGDEIPIRRLHQEATSIENPTHKMIFSGNYLPKVKDPHDKGVLRRFLIIRFTQTFDAAKCDINLKKKLNSADAMNAFLTLLVDNAAQWYKDGLIYSAAMNADKKEFFAAQDFVQDFIESKCNFHSDGVILFSHFLNRLREYPATPAGLTDRELKAHISKTLNKLEGVEKRKSGVYKIFGLNWRVDDKDLELAGEEVPDESYLFG